jgi:hypothetical protein
MWPGLTGPGLLASRGLSPRAGAFYRVVPSPLLSGRERVRPRRGTCLALLFRLTSRTEYQWPRASRTTRTGSGSGPWTAWSAVSAMPRRHASSAHFCWGSTTRKASCITSASRLAFPRRSVGAFSRNSSRSSSRPASRDVRREGPAVGARAGPLNGGRWPPGSSSKYATITSRGPLPPRHPISPLETRQEAAPMLYGSGRVEARLLRFLRGGSGRLDPRSMSVSLDADAGAPSSTWGTALSTAVPPRRSAPASARYGCFFAYSNFGRALMASLVAPGRMNLLS